MAPIPEEAPVTRAVPWVWGEFMTVLLEICRGRQVPALQNASRIYYRHNLKTI
jgi:hypothetical protein